MQASKQKGIFVTGTDTNVGKTWVGKHLIQQLLANGVDVIPRKPIESGWASQETQTDAWQLANAANCIGELDSVCPYRLQHALSPVRAAKLENREIRLKQVASCCGKETHSKQFLHVEGAGGFYSPLVTDGLNADLASELQLPILLVANDRLGCINQILLTLESAKLRDLKIFAIYLNRFGDEKHPKHMDNADELSTHTDIPIVNKIDDLVTITMNLV